MSAQTSFTFKLDDAQQGVLAGLLSGGNYRPYTVDHARIAVKGENCTIVLYNSGKALIQGRGAEDFVTFVMEPLVLGEAALGYEDVLDPRGIEPHMGVDESGKGDFFGPLVTASAYVDPQLAESMRQLGVKDSKRITSDEKAMAMGGELRKLLGNRYSIVKVGPKAYNRLYAKMKNVNTLLAWAHARSIENLLDTVPGCPRAVSDQFGSKTLVQKALFGKSRDIELEQRHKAESDLAVAAASIIAREAFVRSLLEMQKKYDCDIPKGASDRVREMAVLLVKQRGPEVLLETAKCHFKTADAVLESAGRSRADLGPEGQAVSRAYGPGPSRGAGKKSGK